MPHKPHMNIGMLALDPDWIAGTLYICSAVRALQQVSDRYEVRLKLIAPRGIDLTHFSPFIEAFDDIHYFDLPRALQSRSWRRIKLRQVLAGVHLRRIIRKHVDVLFPIRRPLGFEIPAASIGWIPDCQHSRYPQFFSEKECRKRDADFLTLAENCTHMVVSSHDARTDLTQLPGIKADAVSVYQFRTFPEADWFSEDPGKIAQRHNLPERFLYFPSQWWKHKNHTTLLEALKRVADKGKDDVALVLTGRETDYRHPDHAVQIDTYIEQNGLRSRVHRLGVLERQDQIQLMRQAVAIVQPSLFEGWSMLVEDCRAIGKTALVSDIPVHREQAYRHAHYFNPDSAEELADLIIETWPKLSSGPDLAMENDARDAVRLLCEENGALLMDVFEGAMKSVAGRS